MKTRIFAVATAVVVFLASGCGGHRHAILKDKDGMIITHDDSNISLLEPSVGPIELAEAYRIKKDADIREAMIKDLIKSQATGNGGAKTYNYIFALVNNDPRQSVYINHPEMPSIKIIARPGGNPEFIFLESIPYKIIYRRLYDGKIIKEYSPQYDYEFREKMSHKKKINGVPVDFVLQVDQVGQVGQTY
ncbi:MAG: hypothetical protein HYV53_03005 [Parcubacteria group bacterium]|nr:hypothetical protein [Parcubacteria group bacterium]